MRAKIVATIGPATSDPETLKKAILSGMNVARMNFSHGSHEEFALWIKLIRAYSQELDRPIGIIQDLQGPRIRLGKIAGGKKTLFENHEVILTTGKPKRGEIEIGYKPLIREVKRGSRILLSDGLIELLVRSKTKNKIKCVVAQGGEIASYSSINLPGIKIKLSPFTEKDHQDLYFGISRGVDFVALSFVKTGQDIKKIKKIIEEYSNKENIASPKIIAKIESKEAINNLNSIIEASDAVMVARGDLGIELPEEEVPLLQKRIIEESKLAGKPVITATQMLDSMVLSPRPTRAEVSDVANAVVDGTDALMLSNETAIGKFPIKTIQEMKKIAEETEKGLYEHKNPHKYSFHYPQGAPKEISITDAVGSSSCEMAEHLNARYIITTKHRPGTKILALTPNQTVYNQLSLLWGTETYILPNFHTTDELIYQSVDLLSVRKIISQGNLLVIIAGHPVGMGGQTNLIKVHRV
jgi:pyruvate kinase